MLLLVIALLGKADIALAGMDCYQKLNLPDPQQPTFNTLYIFIDQTTPLTTAMKTKIQSLVSDWGQPGERIKIARFSANIKGEYTELMFDDFVEHHPSEAYLFHLRNKDKKALLNCLAERKQEFKPRFRDALSYSLNRTDFSLPKTDLFYSLRELTQKLMDSSQWGKQTVLLISDGLENSDYFSFHARKAVKKIHSKKTLQQLAKQNLLSSWHNAKIYMYGLGQVKDPDVYMRPKLIEPLKEFWQNYFAQANGDVVQLGTPELLMTSLK
jgi:hypothetical protein